MHSLLGLCCLIPAGFPGVFIRCAPSLERTPSPACCHVLCGVDVNQRSHWCIGEPRHDVAVSAFAFYMPRLTGDEGLTFTQRLFPDRWGSVSSSVGKMSVAKLGPIATASVEVVCAHFLLDFVKVQILTEYQVSRLHF